VQSIFTIYCLLNVKLSYLNLACIEGGFFTFFGQMFSELEPTMLNAFICGWSFPKDNLIYFRDAHADESDSGKRESSYKGDRLKMSMMRRVAS